MSWILSLLCRVAGHRWQIVRIAPHLVRFDEDELVGCDANCMVCPARWRDAERYCALQAGEPLP